MTTRKEAVEIVRGAVADPNGFRQWLASLPPGKGVGRQKECLVVWLDSLLLHTDWRPCIRHGTIFVTPRWVMHDEAVADMLDFGGWMDRFTEQLAEDYTDPVYREGALRALETALTLVA